MNFAGAAVSKRNEDSAFEGWLRDNLPAGQRRTYLGREVVVVSHRWTNSYDSSGVGVVVEYRDDAGLIHRAEYRFVDECMAFLNASRLGEVVSLGDAM